jgi:hypothetical protein
MAMTGLLLAGALIAPAAVLASGLPPTAVTDTVNGTEDQDLVVDASALLANDTDPEDDVLTIPALEDDVLEGTVDLVGTTITFHPLANDCGDDTAFFKYDLSDGTNGPVIGMVHVNLACTNDDPVANGDHAPGHEDDVLEVTSVDLTANDTDIDGDDLHVSAVSNPTNGSVSLTLDTIKFTPADNICGVASAGFDYTTNDGNGGTDNAHVTVDLVCNGTNHDPVAANDFANGTEDTQVVLSSATLTSNDTDADADPLHATDVANAIGGTVVFAAGAATFTPTHNLCGSNVGGFDYTLSDGQDTDVGVVRITLTCVNDAPVTHADTAIVPQNSGQADYNVLANDSDPEGDTITLEGVEADASIGTVSIASGKVRYTPAVAFHGEAVITYTATDGTLDSDGTLTVTVGEDEFPPIVATPSVGFGKGRVEDTAKLRIAWSATDGGVGVASYKAQARVGDGAWKTLSNGPATSTTKRFELGSDLTFRVRATDRNGNVSAWKTTTRSLVEVPAKSGKITYTGPWTRVTGAHPYRFATKLAASARLTTTGRQIQYIAPKSSASGFVKVFVDGNRIGRFDLHAGSTSFGHVIAKATLAGSGNHVIKIVNDSKGKRTNLASFVILR